MWFSSTTNFVFRFKTAPTYLLMQPYSTSHQNGKPQWTTHACLKGGIRSTHSLHSRSETQILINLKNKAAAFSVLFFDTAIPLVLFYSQRLHPSENKGAEGREWWVKGTYGFLENESRRLFKIQKQYKVRIQVVHIIHLHSQVKKDEPMILFQSSAASLDKNPSILKLGYELFKPTIYLIKILAIQAAPIWNEQKQE